MRHFVWCGLFWCWALGWARREYMVAVFVLFCAASAVSFELECPAPRSAQTSNRHVLVEFVCVIWSGAGCLGRAGSGVSERHASRCALFCAASACTACIEFEPPRPALLKQAAVCD